MSNYVYDEKGSDESNLGLLIPRYIASGRVAPNGKVYPDVTKKDEDNWVPVRSIITKTKGDLSIVTPDHMGARMKNLGGLVDGMSIGYSFGTSLVENLTQGILGLKHGGHERVLDLSGNLFAPKDCTVRIEGKWLFLKVRGGELKYPLPSNWVGVSKESFKEGELIGTAYNTTSPIFKLAVLTTVLRARLARGAGGVKYFQKDNIIISECFALEDGVIHYTEDKFGNVVVTIGNRRYNYKPESMYYFPDGTNIKKLRKFCSGTVDMDWVMKNTNDINDSFNVFRRQFYLLNNSGFECTNEVTPVEPDYMQEEILELLFAGITDVSTDINQEKINDIKYQGVHNGIMSKESFFTTLSYGYSSKVIGSALKGESKLVDDPVSSVVLGLLLNDQLDNSKK